MSALMTPRRARRTRRDAARRPAGQPSLFTAAPAAPAPVVAEPESAAVAVPVSVEPAGAAVAVPATAEPAGAAAEETFTTPSARRQGPTLDDLVAGVWEGLLAGAPADCLVCGTPLSPRHSAGAGIVGGRCGGCGSTLG